MQEPDYPYKKALSWLLLAVVVILLVARRVVSGQTYGWVLASVFIVFCGVQAYKIYYAWKQGMKKYCLINCGIILLIGFLLILLYKIKILLPL